MQHLDFGVSEFSQNRIAPHVCTGFAKISKPEIPKPAPILDWPAGVVDSQDTSTFFFLGSDEGCLGVESLWRFQIEVGCILAHFGKDDRHISQFRSDNINDPLLHGSIPLKGLPEFYQAVTKLRRRNTKVV